MPERREDLVAQEARLRAAFELATEAAHWLAKALRELDRANQWASWDLLGGGGFSASVKYDRMVAAQSLLGQADSALARLGEQRSDLRVNEPLATLTVDPRTRALAFWLDNVFTDAGVRREVVGVQRRTRAALDVVEELRRRLKEEHSACLATQRSRSERRGAGASAL